jgi:predicted dehydrogenase
MNQKKKYRVGVIGAGARGETFARQLFAGSPHAELFGICDTDPDRLQKFCTYCELDETPQYSDIDEFLSQPELDAVIITTPEWTHADVAVAALAASKHIYLEKPMAHTVDSCRRILQASVLEQSGQGSEPAVFIGFNLRETAPIRRLKEVVDSGVLGQIVHIAGLEQLSRAHGASFMRRFHRNSQRSGGLLNHKCSHDLDILQWLVGHEHKIVKVSSFGGSNVFTPDKQPATHCHECPVQPQCLYPDQAGFVFPIGAVEPMHHRQNELYGADLCVFNDDKDVVDNQTVILEWDNGVRGSFNLQMFQYFGRRRTCIWGELGYAELDTWPESVVRVIASGSGEVTEYRFAPAKGGHGGSDIRMIDRFVEAIESPPVFKRSCASSGLAAGLAATLIAEKADQSRLSGEVVTIAPVEYSLSEYPVQAHSVVCEKQIENIEGLMFKGSHQRV